MSTKLKKDIHKILIEDFSKAMGFDKETGLLPFGNNPVSLLNPIAFEKSLTRIL